MRPRPNRKAWLALVLFLAGVAAGCTGDDATVRIELTEAQIQRDLAERFPLEKRKMLTDFVLADPVVNLREETGQVALEIRITIDPPLLSPRSGTLGAAGLISYRADEHAFYIQAPKIEKIEIQGLDQKDLDKSREPLQALVTAGLEKFPVYKLTGKNLTELTAKHVLRSVSVESGKLVAELGLPQ